MDTTVTTVNQPTSIDRVMEEDKIKDLGGDANNGNSLSIACNLPATTANGGNAASDSLLKGGAMPGFVSGINGSSTDVSNGSAVVGTNNGDSVVSTAVLPPIAGNGVVGAPVVASSAAGGEKMAILGPLVDYDSDSEEESSSEDR